MKLNAFIFWMNSIFSNILMKEIKKLLERDYYYIKLIKNKKDLKLLWKEELNFRLI
jgi:hypothetical protein